MPALPIIPRFIEIIATAGTRDATPAIDSGTTNTTFAVETENITVETTEGFNTIKDNQQKLAKITARISVRVPDTNVLSNALVNAGTSAKVILHGAVGAQGVELSAVDVTGVRKTDGVEQYVQITCQRDFPTDPFTYFTSV